jgi:hypothetical protein
MAPGHSSTVRTGHATRCTCGRRPDTSYCVPRPHAGRCPFPTYPSTLGLVYFQGPHVTSALPTDLAESNTPCASSTSIRNLHLLALVLPFPFPSTGRPLDCAFLNLVGSVIHKVRLHPRRCPPAAGTGTGTGLSALLLDRLVRAAALDGSPPLSHVYLVPWLNLFLPFPFPILPPTLGRQAPNL